MNKIKSFFREVNRAIREAQAPEALYFVFCFLAAVGAFIGLFGAHASAEALLGLLASFVIVSGMAWHFFLYGIWDPYMVGVAVENLGTGVSESQVEQIRQWLLLGSIRPGDVRQAQQLAEATGPQEPTEEKQLEPFLGSQSDD